MRTLIPTYDDFVEYNQKLVNDMNQGRFLNFEETKDRDAQTRNHYEFQILDRLIDDNFIVPTGNKTSVWVEELKQNVLLPEFKLKDEFDGPYDLQNFEHIMTLVPPKFILNPVFENEADALDYVLPEGPQQNYYSAWYNHHGDEIENSSDEWNYEYDNSPYGPDYDPDIDADWREPYEEVDTYRHLGEHLSYDPNWDKEWIEFVDRWNDERDLDNDQIPWDQVAKEFFLEYNIIQHEEPDTSYWMRDEAIEFNQEVKVIIPPFRKNEGGGTDIEAEYVFLHGENDHPVLFEVRDFRDFKKPWTTDFWEGTKRQRKKEIDRKAVEEKTFGLDLDFHDDFYKMQKQLDGSDFDPDSIRVLDDKFLQKQIQANLKKKGKFGFKL